ncbi:MAG: TolC family protein [Verrucomicrobia bacterium]|nr:TolC family protein [Deltaproteobacteria bacterium]
MITLPGQMLAYLMVLFFCQLVPYAQAGETVSPAPPEIAGKAAPSSPSVNPPVTAETGQPPPQLVLSRGNAVAMAVYRNIDLRIEALSYKMSESEVVKSRGMYNPVLNASGNGGVTAVPGDPFFSAKNLNASIGLTQNLPTGGNIGANTQTGFFSIDTSDPASKDWRSTAGLTVTQPLLRNAGRKVAELNITLAASTQQESLERFRAATMETVSNVITAYNHLYVLLQAQETRVAALNSAQKLMDEIKKKATPGAVQGLELANAEFAIAQRLKDLVEASRSVRDQEVNLRYLIGLELPTKIIPSDPPSRDEPLETEAQAVKAAMEHRSDLIQLQSSLKTAQLQEQVAGRQSWPELTVNAGGGLSGSGINLGESYQQVGKLNGTFWTVGMLFSLPLGNTVARNEYLKSKTKTEQTQYQIKALSWKIRNDVESDMRALISARLQIQLSERSSQLAEQRLEEYRRNNQLGSASIQDVLNAENDRNYAHNARLEAVETFSNAVIKLWKDAGLLLNRHGIHIDTSHPSKLTENKEQNPDLLVDPAASVSPPPTAAEQEQTQIRTIVPMLSAAEASDVAAQKPVADDMIKAAPEVPAPVLAASLIYTLTIGEFGVKSAMADAIKRIKRAGLVPLVKRGPARTEAMIRLHVADYPDQKTARLEIGRLARLKVDGFIIIGEGGIFSVYAGSFRARKQAGIEQERLAALGVKTVLQDTSVPLATYLLTVGRFTTREAAARNATKLEEQGLKPAITENAE